MRRTRPEKREALIEERRLKRLNHKAIQKMIAMDTNIVKQVMLEKPLRTCHLVWGRDGFESRPDR